MLKQKIEFKYPFEIKKKKKKMKKMYYLALIPFPRPIDLQQASQVYFLQLALHVQNSSLRIFVFAFSLK